MYNFYTRTADMRGDDDRVEKIKMEIEIKIG